MTASDAQLLISTHCPHCPAALAALSGLVKSGALARLDIVNLDLHPEVGAALGVRSVPWARLGKIVLAGQHTPADYADWAARSATSDGLADWFHRLLKEGQLAEAEALLAADPALLAVVLPIVGNVDASLNVRLGAGVLFENFAGSDTLAALIPALGALAAHPDARVRADACHVLGLTRRAAARAWLVARRDDADPDVREIVAESLAELPA
jgi:hypothetical protein